QEDLARDRGRRGLRALRRHRRDRLRHRRGRVLPPGRAGQAHRRHGRAGAVLARAGRPHGALREVGVRGRQGALRQEDLSVRGATRAALIVVGALVVCLGLALVVLSVVGLDPKERRPGLWLRGELVSGPVTDWSFTDTYPNIAVQTRSWYGLPHSVTTTITA